MTRITTLVAALVLLLAACGGASGDVAAEDGTDAATTEATQAPSTTQEEAETTVPATPASPSIEAKVVFDGESCVYQGPLVVPDGVEIAFDFEATARPENVALVVVGVVDGTTWEEIAHDADTIPASTSDIPSWVRVDDLDVRITPGSLTVPLEIGDYAVTCNTSPTDTDRVYPAALIEVMSDAIEVNVVFDGDSCSYEGPLTVPSGARVNFDFEATARPDHVALVVVGVVDGTTWEEVTHDADTIPASVPNADIPSWIEVDDLDTLIGPGSMEKVLDGGTYFVSCNTSPKDTDRVYPATFIETTTS
jgi:hypothetical protein